MHTLDIKLKPSKYFTVLIILILASTIALIVAMDINTWIRGILTAISLRSGLSILRNYGLLTSATAIYKLTFEPTGCLLQDRLRICEAELCPESTITTWVCILRFRISGEKHKRTCLIFCDALDPDTYRQLLVQLRTFKSFETDRNGL